MLKRLLTNFSYQLNGNFVDRIPKTLLISLNRSFSSKIQSSAGSGGRVDNIIPLKVTREYNIYTEVPTLLKINTTNFEDKSNLLGKEEVKRLLSLREVKDSESDIDLGKYSLESILDTLSYLASRKSPKENAKQLSKLLLEHIFESTRMQKVMKPYQYSILLDYLVGIQLKLGGLKNIISTDKIFNLYFNHRNYLIFNHEKPQTLFIKLVTNRENHQSLPSLIDWIIKRNIDLHTTNLAYLIRHLFNYSKIASILKFQLYLNSRISSQALYKVNYEFVRGYSILGRMNLAEEIIEKMKSKGISIPFFFYLSLIHGYGSLGDIDKLSHNYKLLLNQKVLKVPEKLTNTVASYCKTSDQIKKVLDTLMGLNLELKDELYILNSQIKLSLINNDIITANYIIEEIKEKGIKPNHFTFIPLLDYYTKLNNFEKAWSVFQSSKQYFLNSDQCKPLYDRIINLCCKHKKPELALSLVNDIIEISKDCSSFSPLLEYYFKNKNLAKVIEIYQDLFEVKNLPFNSYLFNIYLKTLCKLGDMNLVLDKFFTVLNQEKLFIESGFIKLISQGLGMNTNVYRILEFFNDPQILEKHSITTEFFNSALFGLLYSRNWDEASKFLELEEFKVNSRTLELICGFGNRHERYGEVNYWYSKLMEKNRDIKPTPLTYENLIISQFKLANHLEVENLFNLYSTSINEQKLSSKVLDYYLKSITILHGKDTSIKNLELLKVKFSELDKFQVSN